jgi:hypothetical protein
MEKISIFNRYIWDKDVGIISVRNGNRVAKKTSIAIRI